MAERVIRIKYDDMDEYRILQKRDKSEQESIGIIRKSASMIVFGKNGDQCYGEFFIFMPHDEKFILYAIDHLNKLLKQQKTKGDGDGESSTE